MLATLQRDHGAKHREPEKQDRRQLVGPDQRTEEDVSADDASEQNDDFEQHQAGGDVSTDRAQPAASSAAGVDDAARRQGGDRAEPASTLSVIGCSAIVIARSGELADGAFEQPPGLVAEAALPLAVEAGVAQLGAEAIRAQAW